jgi:hypothetical protein
VGGDWFVGRGEELDLLRGLLAGVVAGVGAGVGGSVLVEGEQGIGKTALVGQALSAAGDRCRVAWAAADELGQQFPLGLMADCFGREGQLAAAGDQADPGGSGSQYVMAGDPVLAGVERMLVLADRLCAAGPVVQTHVSRILAKLGASSRTEIASELFAHPRTAQETAAG